MIARHSHYLMARDESGTSAVEVHHDAITEAGRIAAVIPAERLRTIEWLVVIADSLRDATWPESEDA